MLIYTDLLLSLRKTSKDLNKERPKLYPHSFFA
jgi:hypothetical protein